MSMRPINPSPIKMTHDNVTNIPVQTTIYLLKGEAWENKKNKHPYSRPCCSIRLMVQLSSASSKPKKQSDHMTTDRSVLSQP